jgi:hypothetical protein
MNKNISFVRIETEISDYRSCSRRKEQDMFGRMIEKISEDRIEIELLTFRGVIKCVSKIGGEDKLDLWTILDDENETLMSESRALNRDYKESISKKSMPQNGVIVEAVQVEVDDKTLSIKLIKGEKSGDVLAVVKETHFPISENEYLQQRRNYF